MSRTKCAKIRSGFCVESTHKMPTYVERSHRVCITPLQPGAAWCWVGDLSCSSMVCSLRCGSQQRVLSFQVERYQQEAPLLMHSSEIMSEPQQGRCTCVQHVLDDLDSGSWYPVQAYQCASPQKKNVNVIVQKLSKIGTMLASHSSLSDSDHDVCLDTDGGRFALESVPHPLQDYMGRHMTTKGRSVNGPALRRDVSSGMPLSNTSPAKVGSPPSV